MPQRTITASGKLLNKPLLDFKGACNGHIVQREFPAFFPNGILMPAKCCSTKMRLSFVLWCFAINDIKPEVYLCLFV